MAAIAGLESIDSLSTRTGTKADNSFATKPDKSICSQHTARLLSIRGLMEPLIRGAMKPVQSGVFMISDGYHSSGFFDALQAR